MSKTFRAVGLAVMTFSSVFGWSLVALFCPIPPWIGVALFVAALGLAIGRFVLEMTSE